MKINLKQIYPFKRIILLNQMIIWNKL